MNTEEKVETEQLNYDVISEEEWDAAMDILYPDDDTSTDVPEYGEGAHDNPDHEHDLSKHNW